VTNSCGVCGAASPDGAKFCVECGARMARACPGCGAPAEGFKFCMECGMPLDDKPPARPTPAVSVPVSELRTTTVLFGDLVGFTTLSESRDPEEVRELLSTYFAVARTVVGRYGGTIEKFIGDAVMAVWGVPVAHEDDAERAVRAGLDLVAEVAALGESVGAPGLAMRVGLVTGPVAVTLGATNEGMVAGDAVNTAARVQAAATPGAVWVDQETRGLTAAAITFSDMGEHELKGKAEPVRLYRADAIVAAVGGAQRVDGLEAPMTGRDREIREVKELFHATQADGRARLAVVRGVAGVGKTRLGWEFEKYIDGLSDNVRWHRGRCLSYGEGVAYWAFAEMVRSRIGLLEGQSGPELEELVRDFVGAVAASQDEAAWLRPRIMALLSASGTGFDRTDLFTAWSTFLERVGGDEPVLLLFEDMQYAGGGLLDLVEHLLESCRAKLFVVVFTRPELVDERPSLVAGRRAVVIDLPPLPDDAMEALVDALVGDLPTRARAALVARAEGVPLYAVETVRSLIDRDAVQSRDGHYVFVDHDHSKVDLAQLTTPTSLRTLVSARLDALTPAERRTVQDASVLGMTFQHGGLMALSSFSDFDVDTALTGLVRKGIIATQDDPRSPELGQFHFMQAIVREVAYDTLARKDRRERHLAAVDHLESTAPGGVDAVAAVVARHLLDALDAGGEQGPQRADLTARARTLLMVAAARAEKLGSSDEAMRTLLIALDLDPDPSERARILHRAAHAAIAAGSPARAESLALEAAQIHRSLGETTERLRDELLVGRALNVFGRVQESFDIARAIDAALTDPDLGDDALRLDVFLLLEYTARALGDHDLQEQATLRHLAMAEKLGDRREVVRALNSMAIFLVDLGSPTAYKSLLQSAVVISREDNLLPELARTLTNLCAETYPRDLARAAELGVESYAVARRVGYSEQTETALVNLAYTWWLDGSWDQLLATIDEWFEDREVSRIAGQLRLGQIQALAARGLPVPEDVIADSEDPWTQVGTEQTRALQTAARGDVAAAAARAAASALAAYSAGDQIEDFEITWAPAVELQLQAGDLDMTARLLELAAPMLDGRSRQLIRGELPRLRGMLAIARGEDPEADLRAAEQEHEAYGAPYLLARTRLDLGRWLLGRGRTDEGRPLLARAREAFEQLGATPYVAEVDRVRSISVG